MENRRQHFRYPFTPKSYWKATFRSLDGSITFSAEIVNLSVGGICIKSDGCDVGDEQKWIVSVALSSHAEPLRIPVERVYCSDGGAGCWGFRFLPLPNATEQEEQDRQIWRFLLEEQRRDRRDATRSAWWSQ